MTTILVTGATGTIGSRLVATLATDRSLRVLAGSRTPAAAKLPPRVEAVELDFARPPTIAAALRGVDRVFLLVPVGPDHVAHSQLVIGAAREAGVTRIVNLSTSAAELEPSIQMGRWHGEADRRVRDSGIAWTSLRPGLFSTDFVNYWRPDPSGNLYLPFRDGAAAYIDPQDIAEVAARVLTSDGHAGKTYVLTGAEPLTAAQVAARIAQATARSIHYIDVPPEAARDAMTKAGMPAPIVDGMTEMFAALAAGRLAGTTGTVRELLGRAPRPFAYSA